MCSTVEDIQYSGEISSIQWRDTIITVEDIHYWLYCTDDIPPQYWTSPAVLMVSLHYTEYHPLYFTPFTVLHIHTLPGVIMFEIVRKSPWFDKDYSLEDFWFKFASNFIIKASFDCPPDLLFQILWTNVESQPSWNPTVSEVKVTIFLYFHQFR